MQRNNKTMMILIMACSLLMTACAPKPAIKTLPVIKPKPPTPALPSLHNSYQPFKVLIQSSRKKLKIGQFLNLQLVSMIDGYAHLYTISSSGKVGSLLENKRITGGQPLPFPGNKTIAHYKLGLPTGTETYILFVSRNKHFWITPADRLNYNLGLTTLDLDKNQFIHQLRNTSSGLRKEDWNIHYIQISLLK